jgi:hypothetical protein
MRAVSAACGVRHHEKDLCAGKRTSTAGRALVGAITRVLARRACYHVGKDQHVSVHGLGDNTSLFAVRVLEQLDDPADGL